MRCAVMTEPRQAGKLDRYLELNQPIGIYCRPRRERGSKRRGGAGRRRTESHFALVGLSILWPTALPKALWLGDWAQPVPFYCVYTQSALTLSHGGLPVPEPHVHTLLRTPHAASHFILTTHEMGTMMPISRMRKLRLRKVKSLARGHTSPCVSPELELEPSRL